MKSSASNSGTSTFMAAFANAPKSARLPPALTVWFSILMSFGSTCHSAAAASVSMWRMLAPIWRIDWI